MTIYRTEGKDSIQLYTLAELLDSQAIYTPAAAPQCDHHQRGEWYCTNPDCVVREVWITAKLIEVGDRFPDPKCPACGRRLKFHHWLHEATLLKVPIPGPDAGQDERTAGGATAGACGTADARREQVDDQWPGRQ